MKRFALLGTGLAFVLLATAVAAGAVPTFRPGAAGIGDPYFPMDGNGGYDVKAYDLELGYDPATDVLTGVATIDLVATGNLSRFNLDLDGLTVHTVTVDGVAATFRRANGELKITPATPLATGTRVPVVVTYDGVPQPLPPEDDGGGFIPTDDGALVVGEPHVAAVWFPVNDHPRDRARYHFEVTVPDGLEVVANGHLVSQDSDAGLTTWVWDAPALMASYLATVTIGEFDLDQYQDPRGRPGGVAYVDAVDPALLVPLAPLDGSRMALSQAAQQTYKRLSRTITVPDGGATLSFWVNRATETDWDFVAVEARTTGQQDWTTLPDLNAHTTQSTGESCPFWFDLHPHLRRYQTDDGDGGCTPSGTTGDWNAASGASDGWEQWSIDLGDFAGSNAQVSISYISDDSVQGRGVAVDDIEVSTGEGSTSFEADGDEMDGWTVPGPPPGSIANANDWITGTTADAPPPVGEVAQTALGRQPEMVDFLSRRFGPYPFADGGGFVDAADGVGFALENQTRPFYPPEVFGGPDGGEATVVHELAHQWYGDRVTIPAWRQIWLNEGFATYAEWLWSAREGDGTPQQIFDFYYGVIPAASPFWDLRIGDPGPTNLFDGAVYLRGAMALHALRMEVGSVDFFRILRSWAVPRPGRPATTLNLERLAERISGEQLDGLFQAWVFAPRKPVLSEAAAAESGPAPSGFRPVVSAHRLVD